ncbi:MAG: NHL repeat-containing protein [Acidobacteria bacterium]|nr:NHL repeat-containing protein [Acidobacteriota bacterium]
MSYSLLRRFGGPAHFRATLRAIAVNPQGHLFAAGDSEVKAFAPNGQLTRRWPTAKQGFGIAIGRDGNVWVGEAGQVERFSPDGRLAATLREETLLGRISAIGFYKDSAYFGDAKNRCIRRYQAGKFAATLATDNRTQGLHIPNGVVSFSVVHDGTLHVANPGKHRVERYSPDGALLGHIGRFDGIDPAGFQGCCNPTNVAVATSIYVTEKADPRAKVYDMDGKLLSVIADKVFDSNAKNMSIAVGPNGHVYVADTVRLEILEFSPRSER